MNLPVRASPHTQVAWTGKRILFWLGILFLLTLVLREFDILDWTLFKRTAGGTSSVQCGGGYTREQINHLAYLNASELGESFNAIGPKAEKGRLLVLEHVGCDTPWTTWIPFRKSGTVHVFRVFRMVDEQGLPMSEGYQTYGSSPTVTGFCSHQRFVTDVKKDARMAFENNLRTWIK